MNLLLSLLAALVVGCQTAERLAEPGPPTEGDRVAFAALIADVQAAAVDELDVESNAWLDDVAQVYGIARAAAGDPVLANPGESSTEAALRALAEEVLEGELDDLLEREEWAVSAVRIYSAWRFQRGDPITVQG